MPAAVTRQHPSTTWEQIHIDYGEWNNWQFLVVMDAFSKWPEVKLVSSTTSCVTINKLSEIFVVAGFSQLLVSDNAPQSVCTEFKEFLRQNNIAHRTSPPYHPSTNGLAEKMVKNVKCHLKKHHAQASANIQQVLLLAFCRFVGRRGLPAILLSDNAKTFKSASKDIHNIVGSREISYLTSCCVTWNFIVEQAPWWGGFWEWMVQLVKRSLRKAIGRTTLTFDQLNTVLIEVESIINSRPLTYIYDDVEGVNYSISPSHLLYGRRITNRPNGETFEVSSTHDSLVRRSKQ